jgi:hypothetical protein
MTAALSPLDKHGLFMPGQYFRLAEKVKEKTVKTTLIGLFVVGALASASPAMAQDSATFTSQTTVPAFCSQLSVGATPMDLGVLTGTTGQLVNSFASSAQTERQLAASFYCNAPSTITIKAEPLMNDTVTTVADSSSFTNRVDYTATIKWSALQNAVSSTEANAQVISAAQPNIGELTIKLSNPVVANNLRPVSGNYSGQVRLTIALAQ